MPDIITSQIFQDGEKGITATKMNNIVAQSLIQPDFYNNKASSPTLDPTDQLLELKGSGSYARITGSQLVSSVSSQVDVTPQIYSARLRSFNAVGNPNFSVDARQCHTPLANPPTGTFICDRWTLVKSALSATVNAGSYQQTFGFGITLPNTNYCISDSFLQLSLTNPQASLLAGDIFSVIQNVEGPSMRELSQDVSSVSIYIQSSVAPLKFSLVLRDPYATHCLAKLCTITTTAWTLITLPNIPLWAAGGSWSIVPGTLGYQIILTFAAGSTYTAPVNDTWQNGNFVAALGADNWLAKPVNSSINILTVQHEPGAVCTTLMDKPFQQNLDECSRYFTKSYNYGTRPGTVDQSGVPYFYIQASQSPYIWTPFKKRMANIPTVTGYSTGTGAAGNVRDFAGLDRAISSTATAGEEGFCGFTLVTPNPGPTYYAYHYTADTGM